MFVVPFEKNLHLHAAHIIITSPLSVLKTVDATFNLLGFSYVS